MLYAYMNILIPVAFIVFALTMFAIVMSFGVVEEPMSRRDRRNYQ